MKGTEMADAAEKFTKGEYILWDDQAVDNGPESIKKLRDEKGKGPFYVTNVRDNEQEGVFQTLTICINGEWGSTRAVSSKWMRHLLH